MKIKLILFSLAIYGNLLAQSASDGENYFNSKQYQKARVVYESLLSRRPNDALYNYRLARCYYELKDANASIKYFEKSGKRYSLKDLYLGELYYETYQFDKSIIAYQTYIASLKDDDKQILELESKIKLAEKASKLMNRVEDIAIVDSVVVNKSEFLKFYKYSSELGSLVQETSKQEGKPRTDLITYTTQRQARKYYSELVNGQLDIFTSFKLLDEWSNIVPISNVINTAANENYPFLLLDGVTLYFASDGEKSLGGYDIFITRFMSATNSFLNPENIGMPFNSPFNDYMMVIDEQRKLGWFATDRYQPEGKVIIYTFVPTEIKKYIKSEDADFVRNVARLKTYRKEKKTTQSTVSKVPTEDTTQNLNFAINDTVVYANIAEFKSEDAIKLWNELKVIQTEFNEKSVFLINSREKYNTATEEEQKEIAKSIIQLEMKQIELNKLIQTKTVDIRNAENIFLKSR